MKQISQRTAKVSIVLNVILAITAGVFYVLFTVQKIEANQQREQALELQQMAAQQREIAEQQRNMADSAALVALIEHQRAMQMADSLKDLR